MKPCILCDLDGTLADVSAARHHVLTQPRDFVAFHTYGTAEAPLIESTARLLLALGDTLVVYVSARHERWREATYTWLRYRFGGLSHDQRARTLASSRLYLRANDDFRKDVIVKAEILTTIRANGWTPILAIDDNPSIIALWESEGILTVKVPGWVE